MSDIFKRLLGLQPDVPEPDGVSPAPEARGASESLHQAQSPGTETSPGDDFADDEPPEIEVERLLLGPTLDALVSELAELLAPRLAPAIMAAVEERVAVMEHEQRVEGIRNAEMLQRVIADSQRDALRTAS